MQNDEKLIKVNSNQYLLVKTLKKENLKAVYVACKKAETNLYVSIKIENITDNPLPTLRLEYLNYERIFRKNSNQILHGIVEVFEYEFTDLKSVVVMRLLGPNLDELFTLCNQQFSLKTMIYLTLQILDILDGIHSLHFVYRNIAPENFLISLRTSANWLYIIDLSFVKSIIDDKGNRIPCKIIKGLPKGYPRYMSINAMSGYEQFERDDFESSLYMLIYFMKQGNLPWMNVTGKDLTEKFNQIKVIKESTTPEMLTVGYPTEYASVLRLAQNLKHCSCPNYQALNEWFLNLFKRENFTDDAIYDWTNILEAKEEHHRKKYEHSC